MNHDFNVEMNDKKVVEMNQRFSVEMNGQILKKYLTKGGFTMNKTLIKKTNKKLIRGDTVKLDIDTVKRKVQTGTTHYIAGIKFVTYEDPEIVLFSIKKDLMIFKNISRFVIKDNTIIIELEGNATLYTYYFMKQKVFYEVVDKLGQFNKPIRKL